MFFSVNIFVSTEDGMAEKFLLFKVNFFIFNLGDLYPQVTCDALSFGISKERILSKQNRKKYVKGNINLL